jgi:pimeloyl-ACP methyl ester carboxylesterase
MVRTHRITRETHHDPTGPVVRPSALQGHDPGTIVYICATEDEIYTPESRRWAAQHIFGVEPIEIEGGHFPMLERPSELADLFVANLESSRVARIRDQAGT